MSGSDEGDKNMSQLSPKVAAGMLIYRFLVGEYQYLLLQASFAGKLHWTPAKGLFTFFCKIENIMYSICNFVFHRACRSWRR